MIAFITDLHIGNKNFSKEIWKEQLRFFEEQFFPTLLQRGVKDVIMCGDFFHNRNIIDWLILTEVKNRFFQWFDDNDVQLHVIVGNHCCYFKSTLEVNSVAISVREYSKIAVYEEETVLSIGKYTLGLVPWILEPKNYKFPKNCDIICGHLELQDFPMVKGINSRDGFSHSLFANYKYVFSGHYHVNFQRDNVIMVGTPYQLTWNDFDEEKGFYLMGDNFELEYVQNTVNPRFVKLYYFDGYLAQKGIKGDIGITAVEALEIAKTHYCRIFVKHVKDHKDLDSLHASLLNVSMNSYKIDIVNIQDIIEDSDSEEFDEKFEEGESTVELMASCIGGMTFENTIDKELLIKLNKEMYKAATNELYGDGE